MMFFVAVFTVVLLLHLDLFGAQDAVAQSLIPHPFEGAQVVETLGCKLTEYYVFKIQERARRKCDQEAAIVGILLADAAQQSRAVVGQLERLVPEVGAVYGAVSSRKMAQLDVGARKNAVEMVTNKTESSALIATSS